MMPLPPACVTRSAIVLAGALAERPRFLYLPSIGMWLPRGAAFAPLCLA